jgi:hypothetical protein
MGIRRSVVPDPTASPTYESFSADRHGRDSSAGPPAASPGIAGARLEPRPTTKVSEAAEAGPNPVWRALLVKAAAKRRCIVTEQ